MKLPYVQAEAKEIRLDLLEMSERLVDLQKPTITNQPTASRLFVEVQDGITQAMMKLRDIEAL